MLKRALLIQIAIIIIVGSVIYAGSLTAPFNFDDEIYLVLNPAIKSYDFFKDPSLLNNLSLNQDVKHNFFLRPVAYLTFAINFSLNELDVRGYHLVNLLLHIANALLVFQFLRLFLTTSWVTERMRSASEDFSLLPLFGALLFVAHPLQTQAVTYIIQRFVPLACFFYLGAVVLYVQARLSDRRSIRVVSLVLSFIATLLAMLTKETSFTLPVVLLMLELMFFTGNLKKRLLRLIPFSATMAVIPLMVMRLAASAHKAGFSALSDPTNLVNFSGTSRWEYLMTQFGVIVRYLRLLFFPVGQNIDYDYILARDFFSMQVMLPLFLLLILLGTALFLWQRSRRDNGAPWSRLAAFGILWFFVTLSVESSLIPLEDLLVEHRIYLPSIGFFITLLAAGGALVTRQLLKPVQAAVVVVIAISLLCGATVRRNMLWADNVSIWGDAVAKSPGKERAWNNLGYWLTRSGRHEEAATVLRKGTELFPDYVKMHMNLGIALSNLNRLDEALTATSEAFKRDPGNPRTANNLATLYLRKGMKREGHTLLLKALELKPDYGSAHYNLGCLLVEEGRLNEALETLRRAKGLTLDDPELQISVDEMIRQVQVRIEEDPESR